MPSPTTLIYTLSLHDALPIYEHGFEPAVADLHGIQRAEIGAGQIFLVAPVQVALTRRSEEHTSELQSHSDLVCRLLLEKKNDAISEFAIDTYKKRHKDQGAAK